MPIAFALGEPIVTDEGGDFGITPQPRGSTTRPITNPSAVFDIDQSSDSHAGETSHVSTGGERGRAPAVTELLGVQRRETNNLDPLRSVRGILPRKCELIVVGTFRLHDA
jgi:hypothetical protein